MSDQIDIELISAAAARLQKLERAECFNGAAPGSRPNSWQQAVIDDWGKVPTQHVVAGNQSGKSQLGSRLDAWFLAENKPRWKRPKKWGKAPLMGMLVGRTMKQVEEEHLRKLQTYFDPDELQVVRVGMIPQKVVHRKTGNTLLLASHHNEAEAREKLQAFVLHYCRLDEMPKTEALFEELERRVQSMDGLFITCFTPKVRNRGIRAVVDASALPHSKKYKMPMFANPILSEERKQKILAELEAYPEAYRKCVLEGDWLDDDFAVYSVPDECVQAPPNYSPAWRHLESADPALQSKHGQVVFAEDPKTCHWYIIRADYVSGIFVPEDLVRTVTDRVKNLNVVRRACDAASTWFIGQASKMGFTYTSPYDKNNRRQEMMKNVQAALGKNLFIAPWCTDLLQELASMQWSETAEGRVVNSRSYHLHDATIYGFDCLPKPQKSVEPIPELHVRLRMQLAKERRADALRAQQAAAGASGNRLLRPIRVGIKRRWR